jgi:hypothetical protein
MQITEQEIHSIEDAGMLDGRPVKLIRTKGGFWIATGKPKGKFRDEALAAGSHPAVVKYNLEKQYPSFQPAMMKSEAFSDNVVVEKHSHFLSDDLRKSGHDIYSIHEGNSVRFDITKQNVRISSADGTLDKQFLTMNGLDIPKEFAKGMAGATVEKAVGCKVGLRLNK